MMGKDQEVPEGLKRDMRAVLLSKTGGTLLPEFERDFKKLMQKKLNYRNLGFESLVELVKSVPDVIRLEYVEDELAHKLFGIAAPNTYMSSVMKRASGINSVPQGNTGTQEETEDDEDNFHPNSEGLYSLCFHKNILDRLHMSESEVLRKIKSVAPFQRDHTFKGLHFIRYNDKKAALKVVRECSHFEIQIADNKPVKYNTERKGKKQDDKSRHTNDTDKKTETSPGCFKCGRRGHISIECPSKNNSAEEHSHKNKLMKGCCFKCGQNGHLSKDCPQQSTKGEEPKNETTSLKGCCFKCGQKGHFAKGCPQQNATVEEPKNETASSEVPEKTTHLYIGNIPQDNIDEIETILDGYSYKDFRIKQTGQSRKVFAFATFIDQKSADSFITKWNGQNWHGRNLLVRYGKDRRKAGSDTESVTSQTEPVEKASPHTESNLHNTSGNMSDSENKTSWMKANSRSNSHKSIDSLGKVSPQKNLQKSLLPSPNKGPGLLGDPRFNNAGHVYNNIAIIPPLPPQGYQNVIGQHSQTISHQPIQGAGVFDGQRRTVMNDIPSLEVSLNSQLQPESVRRHLALSPRSSSSEKRQQRKTDFDIPPLEYVGPASYSLEKSSLSDLPPLEEICDFHDTCGIPPLEEAMPDLERISDDNDIITLFVGNFPLGTSVDDLIELFEPYEPLSFNIEQGIPTKAYIEVPSISAAELAIEELDQMEYNGRTLKVDVAYSDYLPAMMEDLQDLTISASGGSSSSRRVDASYRRM